MIYASITSRKCFHSLEWPFYGSLYVPVKWIRKYWSSFTLIPFIYIVTLFLFYTPVKATMYHSDLLMVIAVQYVLILTKYMCLGDMLLQYKLE